MTRFSLKCFHHHKFPVLLLEIIYVMYPFQNQGIDSAKRMGRCANLLQYVVRALQNQRSKFLGFPFLFLQPIMYVFV